MLPNRFLTAGCAAAGLALCAGLPAPAGAAALSAPVVHESFTLLPCPQKPRTTVQLEGCAEHKVMARDKQINTLNAKIFAALNRTGRADLVTSNADWVTYRSAACTTEASVYAGGTIQPIAYANCLVSIDSSHITELKTMQTALSPEG